MREKKKGEGIKNLSRMKRLPGVDNELQKKLDAKMDEVPARRQAREAFKDIQLGIDHILFKVFMSLLLVFVDGIMKLMK